MLQGDHGAWRRVLRLVGGDPESTRGTVAGDQKRPGLLGIMMGFVGLGNRFQPTKKSRMRWDRRRKKWFNYAYFCANYICNIHT